MLSPSLTISAGISILLSLECIRADFCKVTEPLEGIYDIKRSSDVGAGWPDKAASMLENLTTQKLLGTLGCTPQRFQSGNEGLDSWSATGLQSVLEAEEAGF